MTRIIAAGLAITGALVLGLGLYVTGIFMGWHGQTRGPG